MKKEYALALLGFKLSTKYRFYFLLNGIAVPFGIVLFYLLWKSIYEFSHAEVLQGFTLLQMVQYYIVSGIVGLVFSEPERWISEDVRRGQVARDFLRPISYFSQWIFFEIGINGFSLITQVIPTFVIGLLFFGLHIPSVFYGVMFLVAVVGAFFIDYSIGYVLALASFWMKQITGLRRVKVTLLFFLSGGMIPLDFFPAWLERVTQLSPFAYVRYVPVKIYLEEYAKSEVLQLVGIQLLWVVGLYIVIRIVSFFAERQIVGAGT